MNITPQVPSLSIPTVVNPPTESLRRDNHQREIITQVSALNPSAAEKGVASDKERARTPAQTSEQGDFAQLRKQTEHTVVGVAEHHSDQSTEQEQQKHQQQEQEHENAQAHSNPDDNEQQLERDKQAALDTQLINQLALKDKKVRRHEQAHATIGGTATGSPSYTFDTGPDGKKYAVEGEVSVDLSTVLGNPQATIAKMQKVHAAALAPSTPSLEDIRAAASASQAILKAQSELLIQQQQETLDQTNKAGQQAKKTSPYGTEQSSADFDSFMVKTLVAQESIVPSTTPNDLANPDSERMTSEHIAIAQQPQRSSDVIQRAQRIKAFYLTITQADHKIAPLKFELRA